MFGLVSTQFLEGFSGIFRNCCSPCTGVEKRERERERERERMRVRVMTVLYRDF